MIELLFIFAIGASIMAVTICLLNKALDKVLGIKQSDYVSAKQNTSNEQQNSSNDEQSRHGVKQDV